MQKIFGIFFYGFNIEEAFIKSKLVYQLFLNCDLLKRSIFKLGLCNCCKSEKYR